MIFQGRIIHILWAAHHMGIFPPMLFRAPARVQFYSPRLLHFPVIFSSICSNQLSLPFYWVSAAMEFQIFNLKFLFFKYIGILPACIVCVSHSWSARDRQKGAPDPFLHNWSCGWLWVITWVPEMKSANVILALRRWKQEDQKFSKVPPQVSYELQAWK